MPGKCWLSLRTCKSPPSQHPPQKKNQKKLNISKDPLNPWSVQICSFICFFLLLFSIAYKNRQEKVKGIYLRIVDMFMSSISLTIIFIIIVIVIIVIVIVCFSGGVGVDPQDGLWQLHNALPVKLITICH